MVSPYTIDIPDARLVSIKAKVDAYDWSQLADAGGWSAGVGIDDLKRLVAYWRGSYDWRATERRLNRLPNFTTEVEGERLHFVHLRGDGSKPPLLLLHGWPGSYLEFERLLEPLAADGHDVVVPSLPGFAFSTPITGAIGPRRAAEFMHALMVRLFGQQARYIVQGGDWGAHIASWMAFLRPDALLGFHINMVSIFASDAAATTAQEKDLIARRDAILDLETGYAHQQRTRPQTLGVAMADSPVGVAGWILEKIGSGPILRRGPMAARTSGASSRRRNCSPLSCCMSHPRPPSLRRGSITASGWKGLTAFPPQRASRCPPAWRPFPIRCFCPLRAPSPRRRIPSCIGARCAEAATSPPGRSRS
ncbi:MULTISPECIES: epoxide hydrolase [unclassified Xanthomonas]|uniref:epoxide hydrolase family protein n=1 Tax=unclassified Xanthomonas TaxID=2643310 RepID=UPI0021E085C0|nr:MULTISPECIES: epoxide hydrolase [unclassified Xanthomonas]UYC19760.1 epoxide hydrolase 1 [Xanthomonas sp. CFBP 8443]